MRMLDESDVVRLLDMPSCIRAVEEAFRLRGEGHPTPSAMVGLELEHGSLHAKMASLSSSRTYVAAKVNALRSAVQAGVETPRVWVVTAEVHRNAPDEARRAIDEFIADEG